MITLKLTADIKQDNPSIEGFYDEEEPGNRSNYKVKIAGKYFTQRIHVTYTEQ